MDDLGRLHRLLSGFVAGLLTIVVMSCGPIAPTPPAGSVPTDAEALALLNDVVAAAQRHDFDALCAYGDPNCSDMLAGAGPENVPPIAPRLAGSRVVEPTAGTFGGLVLQLCGLNAAGEPYATEMLVMRTSSGLKAIQPIYWSGMRVPNDPEVGSDPALSFPDCPA